MLGSIPDPAFNPPNSIQTKMGADGDGGGVDRAVVYPVLGEASVAS